MLSVFFALAPDKQMFCYGTKRTEMSVWRKAHEEMEVIISETTAIQQR
ncbi:MAG: hypothetical protein H7Z13_00305 [Ferruginibacter sp.]|nr:hypothetical protein [Ferruginibacter sp.]